jgi:hypothetical protein
MNTSIIAIEATTSLLYTPIDNSYAVCLSDGKNHYLAGTHDSNAKTVRIISPVFINKVYSALDDRVTYEYQFVLVQDRGGLIHSVLYNERGLKQH